MERNNKNNKLFGLFNIVDLLIIVVVIAVAAVGIKVIISNSQNSAIVPVKTKDIEYVVNAQSQNLESVQYVKVGDKIWNSVNSEYLGVVSSVEYKEQVVPMFNPETGEYEEYISPERYSINITIKGNGVESNDNISVEGTSVKIGKQLNVKGKGYVFIAFIVDILIK